MSRCANVRMVRISFKLSLRSQFLHFLKVMVNLIVLMITDHWSGGFCDPKSGACSCLAGWRGALCDDPCPPGTHGANCTSSCQVMDEMVLSLNIGMVVTMLLSLTVLTMVLQCQNQGNCHPVTGNCHCPMGWTVSFWYNWIETLSYCFFFLHESTLHQSMPALLFQIEILVKKSATWKKWGKGKGGRGQGWAGIFSKKQQIWSRRASLRWL